MQGFLYSSPLPLSENGKPSSGRRSGKTIISQARYVLVNTFGENGSGKVRHSERATVILVATAQVASVENEMRGPASTIMKRGLKELFFGENQRCGAGNSRRKGRGSANVRRAISMMPEEHRACSLSCGPCGSNSAQRSSVRGGYGPCECPPFLAQRQRRAAILLRSAVRG